jgi:hypothetical protein
VPYQYSMKPIRVRHLRSVEVTGGLVRGNAAEQWLRPKVPQVSIIEYREVLTFDKQAILSGETNPVARRRAPGNPAAVSPDGTVVIIATDDDVVTAVDVDGQERWRRATAPLELSSQLVMSPDGRHVLVLGEQDREPGQLLVLDVGTGRVVFQAETKPGGHPDWQVRWHPGGGHLTVALWPSWDGWHALWIDLGTGRSRWFRRFFLPTDLLTPTRVLSVRHDPYMEIMGDPHLDNIVIDDIAADGSSDREVARLDLLDIRLRDGGPTVTATGAVHLDAEHVLLTGHRTGGGGRHWLCRAADLTVLGYLSYPDPADPGSATAAGPNLEYATVAALPDGTWLTEHGSSEECPGEIVHRWALA